MKVIAAWTYIDYGLWPRENALSTRVDVPNGVVVQFEIHRNCSLDQSGRMVKARSHLNKNGIEVVTGNAHSRLRQLNLRSRNSLKRDSGWGINFGSGGRCLGRLVDCLRSSSTAPSRPLPEVSITTPTLCVMRGIRIVNCHPDGKMAHSNLRMGHSSATELDHVDQPRNLLATTVTESAET